MAGKIPIESLRHYIYNVIKICDLSSVTVPRMKYYLKYKFKDKLPCERDLHYLLIQEISRARLNHCVNPYIEPPKQISFESQCFDPSEINEIRDQSLQNKIEKKRILGKSIIRRVCYLFKGKNAAVDDPNITRAKLKTGRKLKSPGAKNGKKVTKTKSKTVQKKRVYKKKQVAQNGKKGKKTKSRTTQKAGVSKKEQAAQKGGKEKKTSQKTRVYKKKQVAQTGRKGKKNISKTVQKTKVSKTNKSEEKAPKVSNQSGEVTYSARMMSWRLTTKQTRDYFVEQFKKQGATEKEIDDILQSSRDFEDAYFKCTGLVHSQNM